MNKNNRATLSKAVALIDEAKSLVEEVAQEERDKFDKPKRGTPGERARPEYGSRCRQLRDGGR